MTKEGKFKAGDIVRFATVDSIDLGNKIAVGDVAILVERTSEWQTVWLAKMPTREWIEDASDVPGCIMIGESQAEKIGSIEAPECENESTPTTESCQGTTQK